MVLALFTYAQQVSVSNNLLYDVWLTPNLRVGVRLAPHWSVGLTGGFRPWPSDDATTRKWKHLLLSPDVRFWTDSVSVHHFFGANVIYSHYNVADVRFPFGLYKGVRNERRQGDLAALGMFYGYSWPLGRFWNVEALAGVAVGYTQYNRYACAHCGAKMGKDSKPVVIPQAALNIVYIIPGRPRRTEKAFEPVEQDTVVYVVEEVPFVPVLSEVPDFTGQAGLLQHDNPVLHHISQYRPYDRTQILRRDKEALYVYFPVGVSVLHPEFRENAPVLSRIIDITRQIMADSTSSVKTIQIVGLASIEGSIAGNEKLGQDRAIALQRYIQQQLSLPDSLFDTVGGGEAWAEFRDQLEELLGDGETAAREPVPTSSSRPAASPSGTTSSSRPAASPSDTTSSSRPAASPSDTTSSSRPAVYPSGTTSGSRPVASPSGTTSSSHPAASPSGTTSSSHPAVSPSDTTSSSRPAASLSDTTSSSRPAVYPSGTAITPAALQAALAVIDSEPDLNRREVLLKRLDGGRTWAYLKEHILKDQRNSGYIRIYYDYVPDTAAAVINRASGLLRTDCGDCHREALRLLQQVSGDERAQNALAVALYLCGREDEAIDCFRRAAAQGNADAQENLRQIERNRKTVITK